MPNNRDHPNDVTALALADLAPAIIGKNLDPDVFRAQQIAAIKRTTPHMMVANILSAVLISMVGWGTSAAATVLLWGALMAGVSMYMLVAGMERFKPASKRGRPAPVRASVRATRKANIYAGVLGGLWALLPAATFNSAPLEVSFIIMGVVMGACGLGAFNLSRIPSAAIIYAAIVTSALAASSFMLGGSVGIAAAILGLIYGVALGVMILQNHHKDIKRAEDELALEDQNKIIGLLLREFESGTKDWLWETDASGKLTYASERLVQLSGRRPSRVIGATLCQAVGAKRNQKGWTQLIKAGTAQQPIEMIEVPIKADGRETWWQINANPSFDESGHFTGYRGVAVDITEIRSRTAELEKAKKVAERASQSKSQFLAMMSHELRTPLNSIIGYAELIASQCKPPAGNEAHREYSQNIADQGKHLNQLISNILDMTRLERGRISLVEQEVHLDELVDAVSRMFRIQAKTNEVTLVRKDCKSGVVVRADLTRVKQILINLTANAIKFTPVDGLVELSIATDASGCPLITVADTGIGIDQSKIDLMFEPFTQAETSTVRQHEGAGLGLAISRELARMHGGHVALESTVGKGTRATLLLPVHRVVKPGGGQEQAA